MTMEEVELVARAKAGDQAAFSALVRSCEQNIRAYIARFVNNDKDDAWDIAQETFLKAYRSLDTFDSSQEFYPWVRGIARNLALMFLRRTGRRKRHERAFVDDLLRDCSAERLEQGHRDDVDYVDELNTCLKKLADDAVRLIKLNYYSETSIADMASALNRPPGTVRMMLLRIRQSLRTCIEKELQFQGSAQ